jgi:hypothetical protein
MRYFLRGKFKDDGYEVNGQHDMPDVIDENTWTMVRHPAKWLLSYYAYVYDNQWRWEERPDIIAELYTSADGLFWPQWIDWVCKIRPYSVGQIYDYFCQPKMQVFQLEKIDKIFDERVPYIHVQENKPMMTLEQWYMICEAEKDTLEKYEYDDTPPEHLKPAPVVKRKHYREVV